MRRVVGGMAVAAVTGLLGVSASVTLAVSGPAGSATPVGVTPLAARTGCGAARPSGSTTLQVTVAGRPRTVIVHVPARYRGSTRVPLILNMHGSGATAAAQEALSGMDATSDAKGFLVAYPQGLLRSGTGFDWNVPNQPLFGGAKVPKGAPDDVAFLTSLVGVLAQRYCVNPTMVFATGLSGGARMASQLACDSPLVFAAVAPVSGLRHPTPCPATRPVPIIAFHGTADPIDPYAGHGQAYWTYSVPQAVAMWASQDRCRPSPVQSSGAGFTLAQYGGCGAGVSVELYSITGMGHEWPGGPRLSRSVTRYLGPQSNAVNANQVMWSFFAAHPEP